MRDESSAREPMQNGSGPLAGVRVIEFAGLGPGPFAGMLLSDLGADVVQIERPGANPASTRLPVGRGRSVVRLDLKNPADIERALDLIAHAHMLIEGFRPGVMERAGLGPEVALGRNPRLIYGRITGWGQEGPLSKSAGHDLNYIAITGALNAIGRSGDPPVPPLNLIGDYAGGALYLVIGLLSAFVEAQQSGRGQIIDAAICDGTISLLSALMGFTARGEDNGRRGENLLDGGAPFYDTYRTLDDRYVSVAAIEPKFFALLCERVEIPDELRSCQHDRTRWPALRRALSQRFATRTRAEWDALLAGTDACFAPVMTLDEAADHPHLRARNAMLKGAGVWQAAPAPRFSRTPARIQESSDEFLSVDAVQTRWSSAAQRHARHMSPD